MTRNRYRGVATDKRNAVFIKTNSKCYYCGRRASTIDHVIPRSKGGSDHLSNLIPSCRFCNEVRNVMESDIYKRYVDRFGRPKDISWKQSHNRYKMYATIRIWKIILVPLDFYKFVEIEDLTII